LADVFGGQMEPARPARPRRFFLQAQAQKVFHRLRSVFKKRFSSFLKRVAFAGSHGWRGFQRTFFGLFWQTPG